MSTRIEKCFGSIAWHGGESRDTHERFWSSLRLITNTQFTKHRSVALAALASTPFSPEVIVPACCVMSIESVTVPDDITGRLTVVVCAP